MAGGVPAVPLSFKDLPTPLSVAAFCGHFLWPFSQFILAAVRVPQRAATHTRTRQHLTTGACEKRPRRCKHRADLGT